MKIYILGPVGSGKSTISRLLAKELGMAYIPEFEEDDLTFHRLLNKRNTTNTRESKIDFQYYTLEQAYRRQVHCTNCVVDTPILQHRMMASVSLDKEDYEEYLKYFNKCMEDIDSTYIMFVLKINAKKCLERIKLRGRVEEKLSDEEIEFYTKFAVKLYSEVGDRAVFIDAEKSPKEVVEDIVNYIYNLY